MAVGSTGQTPGRESRSWVEEGKEGPGTGEPVDTDGSGPPFQPCKLLPAQHLHRESTPSLPSSCFSATPGFPSSRFGCNE